MRKRRLWSDWVDAQADLSLRWARTPFCWVPVFLYWPFQGGTSVVVPYCSCCLCLYFGSSIMLVTYFSWMTTYLGKSCSFCLPRVPFVNCRQFMYLVIFLLVLRAGYGIWLYQFLIIAYLFTCHEAAQMFWGVVQINCSWKVCRFEVALSNMRDVICTLVNIKMIKLIISLYIFYIQ